jgi:hypothetical protein
LPFFQESAEWKHNDQETEVQYRGKEWEKHPTVLNKQIVCKETGMPVSHLWGIMKKENY